MTIYQADIEDFEFIDCTSVGINYNARGEASLSFVVVAKYDSKDISDGLNYLNHTYTDLIFGGVRFKGYITDVSVREIEYTHAYEFQFSMTATGISAGTDRPTILIR